MCNTILNIFSASVSKKSTEPVALITWIANNGTDIGGSFFQNYFKRRDVYKDRKLMKMNKNRQS